MVISVDSTTLLGDAKDRAPSEAATRRLKKGTAMSADAKTTLDDRLDAEGVDLGESAAKRLKAEGFEVFEATRGARPDSDFLFATLSKFVACARELGIRVIFLEAVTFEEGEFYLDGALPPEDIDDEDAVVDLRDVIERLRAFEGRIGECQLLVLTGCTGSTSISYYEAPQWFAEFDEKRERAIQLSRASSEQAQELRAQEREQRNQEVTTTISKLIDDAQFNDAFSSGRPTQGAIIAYIRTTITGAEELPFSVLRNAANQLRDRILLKR